jgi:hypothetical protein
MSDIYSNLNRFKALFQGLDSAFGTGDRPGRWIKRPPRPEDLLDHLEGKSNGIGIAPLRPDNTVMFAAIDLDEPDFETAFAMQRFIPGASFVESTRSGNAHVWVFFAKPCPAWVAMGVLREVCIAVGKPHTEVFPKNHDFARVTLGNYINLPFHGNERPILNVPVPKTGPEAIAPESVVPLELFLERAERTLNDPRKWEQRADLLLVTNPADRKREPGKAFGEQDNLHMCAEHIIANAESNPIQAGGRHDTIFAVAKQLSNWRLCDHDEALGFLREINKYAQPPIADSEVVRMLRNAEQHQYTSTGCDMPNVAPYAHPNCPIANPRSR